MKKAVVTFLGTAGTEFNAGVYKLKDKRAIYNIAENLTFLQKTDSFSTFPLLIEQLEKDNTIIALYTKESRQAQEEILKFEKITYNFNENFLIKDPNDHATIFQLINKSLEDFDEIIFDVSHGFRSLPILAIIALITENIKNPKKITNILFAQEEKYGETYKIVDLLEYLDIANISYVLSSFIQNYTVSNHIKTKDTDYQELINMLSKFSEHIMANSLINLLREEDSLVKKIISIIIAAIKHEKSKPLKNNLLAIQEHLQEFENLKTKNKYIQLFELSKIMNKKGYYLNAITLLNEAVSWYCAEKLCDYSDSFHKEYNKLKNSNSYKLVSNAKNIVKFTFKDREYRNELNINDIKSIQILITNINGGKKFATDLIEEVDRNRNNLAHANSDKAILDIKKLFEKLFSRFQTYCIDQDILKKTISSVDTLKDKFSAK